MRPLTFLDAPSTVTARRVTFCLVVGAIALLHILLPFRFPIPWPDETSFVAPAYELARHNTLFVWGMNPDRLVMWMPPGYFVFLAGLFKVFGYSFALVRWTSAVCIVAALWLVGSLIERFTAGRWAISVHAATSVAFLSPYMLMSANIGRMEALLALVLLASALACARGLPVLGAALVACAGTIHLNAVYFVLPTATWFAWLVIRRQTLVVRSAELIGSAVAAVVVGSYTLLVRANISGFLEDIHFQLTLKRFYGAHDPYHPAWPLLCAVLLGAVVLIARCRVDGPAFLALYGISFVLMATEGREIWYDYAPPIGFVLLATALAACGQDLDGWRRHLISACILTCTAGVVLTGYRLTPSLRLLLPRPAMLTHDLLPEAEITQARRQIALLPRGSTIEFRWIGVQPFFLDALDRAGVRWGAPQHSVTNDRIDRILDWRMQCDSPDVPDILWLYYARLSHNGRPFGCKLSQQNVNTTSTYNP